MLPYAVQDLVIHIWIILYMNYSNYNDYYKFASIINIKSCNPSQATANTIEGYNKGGNFISYKNFE